jgi:hypothetical protein
MESTEGDSMSTIRCVLGIALLLGAAGCRTAYGPFDCSPTNTPWPFPGWNCAGGYSEIALTEDTYTVRFEGSGISRAAAEDYALLRAAELTIANGQSHFLVLGSSDSTTTSTTTTSPTYTAPTTTCNKKGKCTTFGGGWTGGGGTTTTVFPAYALTIQIGGESGEGDALRYDATKIQRSIRGKYRLPASAVGERR